MLSTFWAKRRLFEFHFHTLVKHLTDWCVTLFYFANMIYYINNFSKCKIPLYDLLDGFICTVSQVDGLCKLLTQHSRTLTSLEFVHCTVFTDFINAIFGSLIVKSVQKHGIQHLSIVASSFWEPCTVSLPSGFVTFLSSGRYTSVNWPFYSLYYY